MVLKQQTGQKIPHSMHHHQSHAQRIVSTPSHTQRIVSTPTSDHDQNNVAVNYDCNSEGHSNNKPYPVAYQEKITHCTSAPSDNSVNASVTAERISNTSEHGERGRNTFSQQRQRRKLSNQNSYPSHFSTPSINPKSNELFALEDEVQPLLISNHQNKIRPLSSQPIASESCWGIWRDDDKCSEGSIDDLFMNKIFHAELKMDKQKTGIDAHLKLEPSTTDSNSCPTVTKSIKTINPVNPNHQGAEPRISDEDSIAAKDVPKTTKSTPEKNSKRGQTPSKRRQKRKSPSKRKPKFPLLQKEPPIEEQILALPAIALAPSLLAKIVMNTPKHNLTLKDGKGKGAEIPDNTTSINHPMQRHNDVCSAANFDGENGPDNDETSPSDLFRTILKARGHDDSYTVQLEGSEYEVVPSPLQLASYGAYLVRAIQSWDAPLVRKLLGCGLSPNACNQFRDSVLGDLVCKQGNVPIFRCFVDEFDADLRTVDGLGRNLLHHCCWAQEFCRPIVEDILRRDPIQIFLRDKQDKSPLEYVRADASGAWKRFLIEVADTYWPRGGQLPRLSFHGRRHPEGDLPDPPKALSPALAADVSSGKIHPEAVSGISEPPRKKRGKAKRRTAA